MLECCGHLLRVDRNRGGCKWPNVENVVEVSFRIRIEFVPGLYQLADYEAFEGLLRLDYNPVTGTNLCDQELRLLPGRSLLVRPYVPILTSYLTQVSPWRTPAKPNTTFQKLIENPCRIAEAN